MTWGWWLWIGLAVAGSDFEEVRAGARYDAGTRVGTTGLGLSFVVPTGWFGGMPVGSEAVVLGSNTEPGVVLVTGSGGMDAQSAAAFFSEPLPIDGMTVAMPSGAPSVDGKRITQTYTVQSMQGTLHGYGVGRVTDRGAGIAIIALGPDPAKAKALATTIAGTIQEHELAGPTGALAQQLAGKQLLYMKTANGWSDEEHVYLCSDGSAGITTSASGFSPGVTTGSFNSRDGAHGRWTVQGHTVVVALDNGGTRTWPVSVRGDGSLGVDQSNWWVQPQDACR